MKKINVELKKFDDVVEDFLEYAKRRHKKQGFETLSRNFKLHILPYFIDRYVNDLKEIDIIEWQNVIYEKNFRNSFNNTLFSTFSSFIKYCMLYHYINENIVLKVGNFKKKNEVKKHSTYNIFQFRWFKLHIKEYVYKQFFNFLFFYGTRPSEAMALKFSDIEGLKVNIYHSIQRRGKRELDTPKNQSSMRTIRVNLLMKYRFYRLKKKYQNEYSNFSDNFFVFGGVTPLSSSTIDRRKHEACLKSRIKEITQHEFRHSYATRMIAKGVPVDYVSRTMGHSKPSMTFDTYCHNEKRMLSIPFLKWFL